jgi:hypothetical protein
MDLKHIKDTPTVPRIEDTNNVQVEDIRLMLLDHVPNDYNVVSGDYYFSDIEIMEARKRAIEAFNALPPRSVNCGLQGIPDNWIMKTGTCWQACLSKSLFFARKAVQYNAGGVAVDMYGNASKVMKEAAAEFKQEFIEAATALKKGTNIRRAFAKIG